MKTLIADKFASTGVEGLRSLGCEIVSDADISAETLPRAIKEHDPDILVVRSTKVQAPAFETAQSLGVVIRAGAGYDTIDVAAASARGISVANCPGRNSMAVAELAWGLILACDRRIPDQTIELREGRWNKKEYSKARGLYGRTLGILGLGQIGQEVAHRGRAFGMKICAWSRSMTREKAAAMNIGYCDSPLDVAREADVISVHVAATPDTKGLINRDFCQAMKKGAYLVNTSRGSVVDEDALREAIREKGIRTGLDVFAQEPGSSTGGFTDEIVNEPGVYGTHHVGASTDQAQDAVAEEVVRMVRTFMQTGEIPNCVNRATGTTATNLLTVRMRNQPGVLAHVFYLLGQAKVNVEEMENVLYDGAKASCARIQLDTPIGDDLIQAIRANQSVLSVDLTSI